MNKVVYNACYGGFGLSAEAEELYAKRKGLKLYKGEKSFGSYSYYTEESKCSESFYSPTYCRHDPDLVAVVEELGFEASSGRCAKLRVHQLTGNRYMIEEYDGYETVTEDFDDRWTYIE